MANFSATHWVILAAIVFLVYSVLKSATSKSGMAVFCKTCGHSGSSKTLTKGSLGIEIVLWLCFLVPGIIYSLWRRSSRAAMCGACGSADVVPAGSPVAVAMKKTFEN